MDGLADPSGDTQAIAASRDSTPKPVSKKLPSRISAEKKKEKILEYILWCVRAGFPVTPAKKLEKIKAAQGVTARQKSGIMGDTGMFVAG